MRWYPHADGPRNFEKVLEPEIAQHIKPEIVALVDKIDGTVSSLREVCDQLSDHVERSSISIIGGQRELYVAVQVNTKAGIGPCQLLKCGDLIILKSSPGQIFDAPEASSKRTR